MFRSPEPEPGGERSRPEHSRGRASRSCLRPETPEHVQPVPDSRSASTPGRHAAEPGATSRRLSTSKPAYGAPAVPSGRARRGARPPAVGSQHRPEPERPRSWFAPSIAGSGPAVSAVFPSIGTGARPPEVEPGASRRACLRPETPNPSTSRGSIAGEGFLVRRGFGGGAPAAPRSRGLPFEVSLIFVFET